MNSKTNDTAQSGFCNCTFPLVMGVINVTPDSFYEPSRVGTVEEAVATAERMAADGASIIDVGALSTRPGGIEVSGQEETDRLCGVVEAIKTNVNIPVSVDTYRSSVALSAIAAGADIINDISGGDFDDKMFDTIARSNVSYVLQHNSRRQPIAEDENITKAVLKSLGDKLCRLRANGCNNVIVDPGFGFGKTLSQNYQLLRELNVIKSALDAPLLVGLSRKSMLYNLLEITPAESLQATVGANMIALIGGADILRVHDVKAAVETVKIFVKTFKNETK